VNDSSGAVLPGVEITAVQTDTGVSRTATSNEVGVYELPQLPIGPYRLEASLPGFRAFVQTGIVLQVNSNPAIKITGGGAGNGHRRSAGKCDHGDAVDGCGRRYRECAHLEIALIGRQVSDLILLSGPSGERGHNRHGGHWARVIRRATTLRAGFAATSYTLDGAFHNDVSNASFPLLLTLRRV
jgi:hypothetical protein